MTQQGKNNGAIFYGTDSGKRIVVRGLSFLEYIQRQLLDGHMEKEAGNCQVRTPTHTCTFTVRPKDRAFCQLIITDTKSKEEYLHIQQIAFDKVLINHRLFVDTCAPYIAVLANLLTTMNNIQRIRGAYQTERTALVTPTKNVCWVQMEQLKSLFQRHRKAFSRMGYATIVHALKVAEDVLKQPKEDYLVQELSPEINSLMRLLTDMQMALHDHIGIEHTDKQFKHEDKLLIKSQAVFTQALDIQTKLK